MQAGMLGTSSGGSKRTRLLSKATEQARKPATKPAMWAKLFIRGTKPKMASTAVTRASRGKVIH